MKSISESLTKIIATIGPACNNKTVLEEMIKEGLDVCRLNFSHGTHEDHKKAIQLIHQLNDELGTNVAILVDLQGPKLRIGDVENNGVMLENGKTIVFTSDKCLGTPEKVYMSYKEFPKDVKPGETVLVDDGKIKLEVIETNKKNSVKLKVIAGGILSSRKGVNLPNTKVSLPSLTEKDTKDAHFALKHNIDYLALSFVRKAEDIHILRDIIKQHKREVRIIAKIEKPEAIENFDAILKETDGVMVARGDLGVETPFNRVPVLQKLLVHKCIQQAKPVIIATQMMESMITNFLPTRAEATDVSNAVLDGADAVMLSGETSMGKYPVETIINMQKVISSTEASGFYLNHDYRPESKGNPFFLRDSVCYNACDMANLVNAAGIVVFTFAGTAAIKLSSHRPKCPVYAFATEKIVRHQLNLVRGMKAFEIEKKVNINDATEYALEVLKQKKLIKKGDKIVFVGGIPMAKREQVNMVKVSEV